MISQLCEPAHFIKWLPHMCIRYKSGPWTLIACHNYMIFIYWMPDMCIGFKSGHWAVIACQCYMTNWKLSYLWIPRLISPILQIFCMWIRSPPLWTVGFGRKACDRLLKTVICKFDNIRKNYIVPEQGSCATKSYWQVYLLHIALWAIPQS